ncbi:hypothetical protein [Mesorhizobium sp. YM1C-6-2]|uniref:hypothetical protein n=1 Tax=Mesorhizobium sp. YM1C-6-2 TaxID=1827501 RepID=UPI000EF28B30|nr:hypothetical protein [Mesorhizobium sp. YM1C-6-2]RLP27151.1 hypothetical protein D8676_08120 [Mesorhizobium sp. YM1C-6-2]
MKNIQIIEPADNCAYNIYAMPDEDFKLMFPDGQDIEFVEDFWKRIGPKKASQIYSALWPRLLKKPEVQGIHGTLFVDLTEKKRIYPNKRFSDDPASAH